MCYVLRYFKVKRKIFSCNTKKLTAVYASKLAKTYQDNQKIASVTIGLVQNIAKRKTIYNKKQ